MSYPSRRYDRRCSLNDLGFAGTSGAAVVVVVVDAVVVGVDDEFASEGIFSRSVPAAERNNLRYTGIIK